ncbi:MAG TPA: ABC transporter permease [Thermoplasmata archaeon]|nr:ABC transporter permease [Thermoplasmata archaeon]
MSERNRLRSIGTLVTINGLVPIRTQPFYLVSIIAQPLSFLFFIWIVSRGADLAYGLMGGMVLTMLSVGTGLQSDLTHYRHDMKFQDVVIASPVEAPVYVAGMALSELVYSLPALGVFVLLFVYYGYATPSSIVILTGVLLLVWSFGSAFAFTLSTYFQDIRETWAFSPIFSLVLTVLPPVYYPLKYLPSWAQFAARFSPTTYAAELVQGAVGLQPLSFSTAVLDWIVLVAFTVALFLIAAVKARWRDP